MRAALAFYSEELDKLEGEAREARIAEIREEWEKAADPPLKSFLDLTDQGLGEIPFEDQAEAEQIILNGISLADFLDGDEALLRQLQPQQRKRILEEALVKATGEKKRRRLLISGPEAKAIDYLQEETSQGFSQKETVKRRKRLREVPAKEGPEAARTPEKPDQRPNQKPPEMPEGSQKPSQKQGERSQLAWGAAAGGRSPLNFNRMPILYNENPLDFR